MRSRGTWIALLLVTTVLRCPASLGPDEHRADLQYVVTQLPSRHPNPFATTSSSTFYSAASRLDADLPGLTSEQFYVRLNELVAMIRDLHTRLFLEGTAASALGFTRLPIRFDVFSDGVFVVAAPSSHPHLNRARLLRINGVEVADALTRLEPQVSLENEFAIRAALPSLLSNSGILRGLGLAPAEGAIPFTLRLYSGEETTIALNPDGTTTTQAVDAGGGYLSPLMNHAGENYWSEYWADMKALYVRYAECLPMGTRPVAEFTADIVRLLDRNPVDTLIFDVRGNTGGTGLVTIPLVTAVVQRLTSLRSNPKFRVYALIDAATASAGLDTAEYFKLTTIPASMGILGRPGTPGAAATLVGEPTGGKPGYYAGVQSMVLPRSRLVLNHSTTYSPVLAGIPAKDALYPDIDLRWRSTDYFGRHDPVVAAVLARSSVLPYKPSGTAIVVNAASFRFETGIAPGSFASAFGSFPGGPVELKIDGRSTEVLAANATQLVFRVPPETKSGLARIEVIAAGERVCEGEFQVTTAGPGLFVSDVSDPAQPGAVLNENGAVNSLSAPAAPESIVQVFATGNGIAEASGEFPVIAWVANRPAEVLYSGVVQGIPGLWQINIRIPDGLGVHNRVPLFIASAGYVSNAVTLAITR